MPMLSLLFSAYVVLFNTTPAHAQEAAPQQAQSCTIPANLSGAYFFDCETLAPPPTDDAENISGQNYKDVYVIKLSSSCTPKAGKGLFSNLPLQPVSDPSDPNLKYNYDLLLKDVMGLQQKDL